MVVYISVQLSLLTCFFITASWASTSLRQNFQILRPNKNPSVQEDHGIDYCGENMAFKTTGSAGEGGCVCRYESRWSGWGRPQLASRIENLCWNLGERGPCRQGHALVPIGPDMISCGIDACARKAPRNPVGHSVWSEANANSESIFDFTYKGECYRTESKAFCGEGQVVRFLVPSKSPACVSRTVEGSSVTYAFTSSVSSPCSGSVFDDGVRRQCTPKSNVEIET